MASGREYRLQLSSELSEKILNFQSLTSRVWFEICVLERENKPFSSKLLDSSNESLISVSIFRYKTIIIEK